MFFLQEDLKLVHVGFADITPTARANSSPRALPDQVESRDRNGIAQSLR